MTDTTKIVQEAEELADWFKGQRSARIGIIMANKWCNKQSALIRQLISLIPKEGMDKIFSGCDVVSLRYPVQPKNAGDPAKPIYVDYGVEDFKAMIKQYLEKGK